MKKLGIAGCGNIGSIIAKAAEKDLSGKISEIILFDTDKDKMSSLSKLLSSASTVSGLDGISVFM